MSNGPFAPELRTMAFVPRWAILMAGDRGNIASHSFYVALYTKCIASVIKWKGPVEYALWQALLHDVGECFTSDIVGPAKKYIIDKEKENEFINDRMEETMPGLLDVSDEYEIDGLQHKEAMAIVACADKLDAFLFLIGQKRMGNTVVERALERMLPEVEGAWRDLPAEEGVLSMTWQTCMLPAIKAHYTEGGRGI